MFFVILYGELYLCLKNNNYIFIIVALIPLRLVALKRSNSSEHL